ncbi:xanthine dehydrogenase family protein subunit M [Rhizobium sp. EC-SD404]|uniref:FAD binding domain-containing protein n=1 Tax=Rhizobium sp. EC-SD404 TaxID=2038389 RepID=UPI0012519680|nr:xanthine dehydrogenase family protein subunit M [Rhizobium sp. EC-SD404]VVT26662.1 putative oxidoreductase with FAD-binding domain [Rhizobium sp. EC-SD404]
MTPFTFERADKAAASAGARYLGGGTNLIDLMKLEIERPEHLVDVSRLPGDISETDGAVVVGASVTNAALSADPLIRERYPLLSTALLSGATQQLRNKATTGGNFLQRTRCHYFYDTARACNKREPGSGCDALEGHNRFHAILGASEHCIAVHPSDMAVAMAALDAEVRTKTADGEGRTIPVSDLLRLPGDTPERDHVLDDGELIVEVRLPANPPARQLYRKVRDRASYAFAVVSVAVALDVENGVLKNVRIALGGVAHKPWRAKKAERVLEGAAVDASIFAQAADAELQDAVGRGDNDFKIPLVRRLIVATLRDLTDLSSEHSAKEHSA